ncbi:hypothetical protein FA15DRAFT_728907 [Coprinopsis marcescibilis]|uniref:Uncharacterized protein n=1 Tax=Coprinopsis marcescibilis TaxID=230819 RepID=A0A5C3KFH9_COPMA|nr:hypothetical protein FA15DRAFT_728907 [Coprinopsis marcescibilis]
MQSFINSALHLSNNEEDTPSQLSDRPPILIFEIADPFDQSTPPISPSPIVTVPVLSQGQVEYDLKGIIYSGGYHFNARIITGQDSIWTYDGQKHGGQLQREPFTSTEELLALDGKRANAFLYTLRPNQDIALQDQEAHTSQQHHRPRYPCGATASDAIPSIGRLQATHHVRLQMNDITQ